MGFAGKEVVFVISTISACLGFSAMIVMNQEVLEALLGLLQAILIFGLIVTLMLKGRELACKPEGKSDIPTGIPHGRDERHQR